MNKKQAVETYPNTKNTSKNSTSNFESSGSIYQQELNNTKDKIALLEKNTEDKLNSLSIRIIEILGVFVTLFTFISVDVQIFKNISSLNNAVFFVILMFFCLIGFVFFLHIILNNNEFSLHHFFVLISLLLVIMIFFVWTGYHGKSLPLENTQTINELQKKIDGLEQRMNGFSEIENIRVSNQNFIK